MRDGKVKEVTYVNSFVQRPGILYYDQITGIVQTPHDLTINCHIDDGYCKGAKYVMVWDLVKQQNLGTIKSFYNNEDVEKTMVTITVKDDKYQELSTTECESNKYWVIMIVKFIMIRGLITTVK